jgi:hypothetical protein
MGLTQQKHFIQILSFLYNQLKLDLLGEKFLNQGEPAGILSQVRRASRVTQPHDLRHIFSVRGESCEIATVRIASLDEVCPVFRHLSLQGIILRSPSQVVICWDISKNIP